MRSDWVSPKIVIGPPATGNYYYERNDIVDEIWEELYKGSFILIAAPRRVGKTSIMKFIAENERDNYKAIFKNIQGINSKEEFYKTLYGLILSCLHKSQKLKARFLNYLKTKKITEVDIKGSFKIESKETDYIEEINNLIPQINKDDETIVLIIDELPEMLYSMHKNGNREDAASILKNLRRWRQGDEFNKLRFILAGSIGIHYVVDAIEGRNSDLNDLKRIDCGPLNAGEALDFINRATAEATIQYNKELESYLLEKIKTYYTPHFISIMLDEVNKKARKQNILTISIKDIDDAFEQVIKTSDHFTDWQKRLSDYLPKNDFSFVNEVLTHIAHTNRIPIQEVYNKATKYNKQEDYMQSIRDLVHDGYIREEGSMYHFISPFLKEFWKRNNPVYHG